MPVARTVKKTVLHNIAAIKLFVFIGLFVQSAFVTANEEMPERIPRTIIALYDSHIDRQEFNTNVHQLAEMPLNHLGLKINYHDIYDELPSGEYLTDVRGILLWLPGSGVPNPDQLIHWLIKQIAAGRSVVVMGGHGFERNMQGEFADKELIKWFWKALGLKKNGAWTSVTYDMALRAKNMNMIEYERSFLGTLPPFPEMEIIDKSMESYASVISSGKGEKISEVISIGSKGSYVASGYAHITIKEGKKRYWFLDPYDFFRRAFAVEHFPIPDTTTQAGRRIYYSHIDGDGWRKQTLVPGYKENNMYSAEVILKEIIIKYPDLPVTVAPVAGDLDEQWFGTKEAVRLARKIFELPNVEASSHTYSHPFHWEFFKDYKVEAEKVFMEIYEDSNGTENETIKFFKNLVNTGASGSNPVLDSPILAKNTTKYSSITTEVKENYRTPRAFYNGPYDLKHDISGSIEFIKTVLPYGKRVELLQWTGNTLPFPGAIRESRRAGVRNLNGGDTRFDSEFDSVSWVMPIGRNVEGEQQIYASASNENTYTDFWTTRFFGHEFLIETFARTESPTRLKPMNIYYHMYSGERLASLNALRKNLDYVQSKSIAPITASQFAGIADGFYATEIEKMEDKRWGITNRGELQTIRFDKATFKGVDFSRSEGVIGQTHVHGSLYVALEPDHSSPIIALKTLTSSSHEPEADIPYLINSRWKVHQLEISNDNFQFKVKGFGHGEMVWYVPQAANYHIQVNYGDGSIDKWTSLVDENHKLIIPMDKTPVRHTSVSIQREAI